VELGAARVYSSGGCGGSPFSKKVYKNSSIVISGL